SSAQPETRWGRNQPPQRLAGLSPSAPSPAPMSSAGVSMPSIGAASAPSAGAGPGGTAGVRAQGLAAGVVDSSLLLPPQAARKPTRPKARTDVRTIRIADSLK